MEIWKDIEGYKGLYQVSNLGRIKSLGNNKNKKEKILKSHYDNNGYYSIVLYKNNNRKKYLIHRLIAEAFIPNPNNLPCVNHKDENKQNNNVDNLEWCTQKYNMKYSLDKKVICIETKIIYNSLTEASSINKIDLGLLSRVCNQSNYTAGGYHWKTL